MKSFKYSKKVVLIFESHPPKIEPADKLDKIISAIQKYFTIKEKPDINMISV